MFDSNAVACDWVTSIGSRFVTSRHQRSSGTSTETTTRWVPPASPGRAHSRESTPGALVAQRSASAPRLVARDLTHRCCTVTNQRHRHGRALGDRVGVELSRPAPPHRQIRLGPPRPGAGDSYNVAGQHAAESVDVRHHVVILPAQGEAVPEAPRVSAPCCDLTRERRTGCGHVSASRPRTRGDDLLCARGVFLDGATAVPARIERSQAWTVTQRGVP